MMFTILCLSTYIWDACPQRSQLKGRMLTKPPVWDAVDERPIISMPVYCSVLILKLHSLFLKIMTYKIVSSRSRNNAPTVLIDFFNNPFPNIFNIDLHQSQNYKILDCWYLSVSGQQCGSSTCLLKLIACKYYYSPSVSSHSQY